jgi:hypothetical protein
MTRFQRRYEGHRGTSKHLISAYSPLHGEFPLSVVFDNPDSAYLSDALHLRYKIKTAAALQYALDSDDPADVIPYTLKRSLNN